MSQRVLIDSTHIQACKEQWLERELVQPQHACHANNYTMKSIQATIISVHYGGWTYLAAGRREITRAFAAAGIAERLHFLPPGRVAAITV